MTLPDAGHWNVPEPPPHILEEHLDRCDPPEGEAAARAPGPVWAEAPAPAQQGGLTLLWALHKHATRDDWLYEESSFSSSVEVSGRGEESSLEAGDPLWPYK